MPNKIRIYLDGIEYLINSDDDEAYVRHIGERLNKSMENIKKESPYLSTTMVAVLSALDFCDRAYKASVEAENLRQQLRTHLEDEAKSAKDIEEYKKEIERLKKDIDQLLSRS